MLDVKHRMLEALGAREDIASRVRHYHIEGRTKGLVSTFRKVRSVYDHRRGYDASFKSLPSECAFCVVRNTSPQPVLAPLLNLRCTQCRRCSLLSSMLLETVFTQTARLLPRIFAGILLLPKECLLPKKSPRGKMTIADSQNMLVCRMLAALLPLGRYPSRTATKYFPSTGWF